MSSFVLGGRGRPKSGPHPLSLQLLMLLSGDPTTICSRIPLLRMGGDTVVVQCLLGGLRWVLQCPLMGRLSGMLVRGEVGVVLALMSGWSGSFCDGVLSFCSFLVMQCLLVRLVRAPQRPLVGRCGSGGRVPVRGRGGCLRGCGGGGGGGFVGVGCVGGGGRLA